MKIVFISDIHGHTDFKIPDGDLLLASGDLTRHGKIDEITKFAEWMGKLPHTNKVVIAGNHDFCFEKNFKLSKSILNANNIIYLQDSQVVINNMKIWGSPWQPRFYDWAFNVDRGSAIRMYWDLIPPDTDILLTHGPPHGILDQTVMFENVGCEELRKVVLKIKPKIHVFGHIHNGYGTEYYNDTLFVNASVCNEKYQPINPVFVLDV